jgi:hypothetical protein
MSESGAAFVSPFVHAQGVVVNIPLKASGVRVCGNRIHFTTDAAR